MYFKYKIEKTGDCFWYSNKDNSLYKEDFTPVIEDKEGSKRTIEGSFKKSNKPKHIRISMGKTCNYSCVYCLQDGLSDKKDIEDPSLDGFIESITSLDLSALERVELWGGEPFLYWETMKKLLSSNLDRAGVIWYICSNGSIIKDMHLDYLDGVKGFVALGISHDGPKQDETRGRCPLSRLAPLLRRMDKTPEHYGYGFQVTLSHGNYDVYSIQEFFSEYVEKNGLLGSSITYVPVESYDLISYSQTIHGENLQKLQDSIRKLLDKNMKDYKAGDKKNLMGAHDLFLTGSSGIFSISNGLKYLDEWPLETRCGALWDELISVDIKGNVLSCPHVSADEYGCGSLDKIADVEIVRMLKHEDYKSITDCASCPVMVSCQYGCPLDLPDEYRKRGCDALYSFYIELYMSTFRMLFESEITYIERTEELNG